MVGRPTLPRHMTVDPISRSRCWVPVVDPVGRRILLVDPDGVPGSGTRKVHLADLVGSRYTLLVDPIG
jgi:hypothetical protein